MCAFLGKYAYMFRKHAPHCSQSTIYQKQLYMPASTPRLTAYYLAPDPPSYPPEALQGHNEPQLPAAFRCAPSRFQSSPEAESAQTCAGRSSPPQLSSKIHFVECDATPSRFPLRSKPLSVIRRPPGPLGMRGSPLTLLHHHPSSL